MSADLYISDIDEERSGSLLLKMNASGHLFITSLDKHIGNSTPHELGTFSLPPTPEGWKEVENLIGALQEWVRHTKELEERRIWAESLTLGSDR